MPEPNIDLVTKKKKKTGFHSLMNTPLEGKLNDIRMNILKMRISKMKIGSLSTDEEVTFKNILSELEGDQIEEQRQRLELAMLLREDIKTHLEDDPENKVIKQEMENKERDIKWQIEDILRSNQKEKGNFSNNVIAKLAKYLVAKEFEESEHPRDESGEFTSGEGGSKKDKKSDKKQKGTKIDETKVINFMERQADPDNTGDVNAGFSDDLVTETAEKFNISEEDAQEIWDSGGAPDKEIFTKGDSESKTSVDDDNFTHSDGAKTSLNFIENAVDKDFAVPEGFFNAAENGDSQRAKDIAKEAKKRGLEEAVFVSKKFTTEEKMNKSIRDKNLESGKGNNIGTSKDNKKISDVDVMTKIRLSENSAFTRDEMMEEFNMSGEMAQGVVRNMTKNNLIEAGEDRIGGPRFFLTDKGKDITKKIFKKEDDAANIDIMKEQLEKLGFTVTKKEGKFKAGRLRTGSLLDEFKTATGERYVTYFLLNATTNLKGWGVTPKSIPQHIASFKNMPFVITSNKFFAKSEYGEVFDHPSTEHFKDLGIVIGKHKPKMKNDMMQQAAFQEEFRVGNIEEIIQSNNGDWLAFIKIKPEFANMQMPPLVSPAIFQLNPAEPQNKISQWVGMHLAGLDEKPAYGNSALFKGSCFGSKGACMTQLSASVSKFGTGLTPCNMKKLFNARMKVAQMKIGTMTSDIHSDIQIQNVCGDKKKKKLKKQSY